MEETLQTERRLKRDLTVKRACSGKNVGNWLAASYYQGLGSWWLEERKRQSACISKCSSRAVGVLTYNCTTAAVPPLSSDRTINSTFALKAAVCGSPVVPLCRGSLQLAVIFRFSSVQWNTSYLSFRKLAAKLRINPPQYSLFFFIQIDHELSMETVREEGYSPVSVCAKLSQLKWC